jgi:hypothetical protein
MNYKPIRWPGETHLIFLSAIITRSSTWVKPSHDFRFYGSDRDSLLLLHYDTITSITFNWDRTSSSNLAEED